jgi:hypothetical protein
MLSSSQPIFVTFLLLALSSTAPASTWQFNRDIRPILAENCFACHGPDKNQRKAKLRLDLRDVAIEREAIVPGKPEQSKLIEHILSTDPDEVMPPPKTHKTLSPEQKEKLRAWIAAGAEYEPHWAYIKPRRFDVPRLSRPGESEIDAFVRQTLLAKNIQPSPEADKRTLLRRLSLDLTGLPPSPAELNAFLADHRSDAYERQVNRLLASAHFGERMAVPWLDIARFTDTVGYHGDQNQRIFPYRDFVIDAFNKNKPFDQFTVEQLAGDLLPNPSTEALVGTGFNRLNMMTREGGAQPKEYLAKYAADRVRTVSMAWLGSTMGCCECHDHKFDPFSTKDFYQMEAFFADLKQWGVYMEYTYTPNPDLRGFSNDHPFPPEIEVDNPYLQRRLSKLQDQREAVLSRSHAKLKSNKEQQADFHKWQQESLSFLKLWPEGWATPRPEVSLHLKDTNSEPATNFSFQANNTVVFTDKPRETLKLSLPLSNMWVSAIRLEIVPQEISGEKRATRKKRSETAVSLAASLKRQNGKESKIPFYFADADHKKERYANGAAIIGVKDLWQISTEHGEQSAVWLLDKPVQVGEGDLLIIALGNLAVSSVRVSLSPFSAQDPLKAGGGQLLSSALTAKLSRNDAKQLLGSSFLLSTQNDPECVAEIRKLDTEIFQCRHGRAFTMVAAARDPLPTRILPRGNWQDESGEVVQPAPPHFLPQIQNLEGRRLTRLDLATWLISSENPLTARTVVNRLWKQFFGTGISAVVDDLGAQGEWPVQPELLDWLACEFMQPKLPQAAHPWDVKHIVKLMVMSATYRQSSNQRLELKDIDPNNRLLAWQSPRRLEAEFVRDNALAIAGILNEEIGGPSVYPYQPPGYYANLQFPDRDYYSSKDDRQYRRGVYAHWQRTFLQPMLANFDAPAREECLASRVVSNTPQQALTLLNDPTFVEASRVFAARVLESPSRSDDERIDLALQKALARPANPREKQSLVTFLATQREHYASNQDEADKLIRVGNSLTASSANHAELAAWTQVCRVILNLQETITRY